ncbi:hypothetical protein GGR56DRAFT_653988 [Xylariaceae sp. FL0804]|nr:hypothetical protein GGR56DRAFT_653988 [Xylariaceae sp. FL0804]
MSFNTPQKSRPPPGQQGSTPFRSASANRFRSSLVPMTGRASPGRSLPPSTKPVATLSSERDLFRTATPKSTRTTKFAPSLPADATRTPAGVRKMAPQKSTFGGLSNTVSTEPFKMRIPSPDPELTGEAVSKAFPVNPTSTAYADQFLAHKCPSHFDELQRRQFFCVLDLRRLKYTADEVFTKKDWKLNITNFAKEYEKSRGMIMLRYGLYEFKNVKPSEAVLKKWRAAHGLPDPEPEDTAATSARSSQEPRQTGASKPASTKRKAEDELVPKDNALMASTVNQNKRSRNLEDAASDPALTGPAPFKKTKRKVDETDEPDENQPSKLQKQAPSSATSKFESILNKAQGGGASPAKRSTQTSTFSTTEKNGEYQSTSLFGQTSTFSATGQGISKGPGMTFASKTANGGTTNGSIFSAPKTGAAPVSDAANIFSAPKTGAAPAAGAANIFGYLSESSANNSGNENGNSDDGDESGAESEGENESQNPAPSYEPSAAASTGTSTPPASSAPSLLATSKPSTAPNIFGGVSKPNDFGAKGGLFGRVQMGANGQPLRETLGPKEKEGGSAFGQPAVQNESTQTPAKKPGDYTFDPTTTPISFGQSTANTSKPATGASETEEPKELTESNGPLAKQPSSIFGANNQSKTPSLFGMTDASKSKATQEPMSIFASEKRVNGSADLSDTNQSKPREGSEKSTEIESAAPKDVLKDLGSKPTPGLEPKAPAPSIFGNAKEPLGGGSGQKTIFPSTTSTASSSPSIFGQTPKPSGPSIFGSNSTATPFGSTTANGGSSGPSKSIFEDTDRPAKRPNAGLTFGGTAANTTSDGDKQDTTTTQETKAPSVPAAGQSIFSGFGKASPAPISNLFPNVTKPAEQKQEQGVDKPAEKKPEYEKSASPQPGIFGAPSSGGSMFNFGGQATPAAKSPAPATPAVSFGAGSATPSFSFGASGQQNNGGEAKKPDFQFGGSTPAASSTAFAFGQDSSAGSSFTFTAGGGGTNQTINNPFATTNASSAAPIFGGNSGTPTPSSSFTFAGGQPAQPTPSTSFTFGSGQQAPPTPKPAPASQSFTFGATSNGANGAPNLSFTQATPPQNTPNATVSKPGSSGSGMFGFLQTGGDASARSGSPFPAPSSMGTTPANGTPEPQTQNEDGEEKPQEQLTLTDGGPGEEDETLLHEVRAKAIKYVPVEAGDDEGAKKSPWTTQGVGPLRVLKNKATGSVRILLRAEPRGHIAMNKTILADIEYQAKEKTLNFVAASDDGSCLETWVLQVKKPEFARELADMLEANKSANKK